MVKFVRKVTFTLICLILILWSGTNVYKQYRTLMIAKIENAKLKEEIGRLENENIKLKARIEYATSSASRARQAREVLGWGGPNDYWLKYDRGMTGPSWEIKPNEGREESNWEKWWKLFTKAN